MEEMMQENQTNQPVLGQTPVTVEKKKVSPLTIAILLIVILLAGVGGVYAGMQISKKQTPVPLVSQPTLVPTSFVQPTVLPTSIPTSDPTAGWKVYINSSQNYSFKYPETWNAATNKNALAESLFGPNASTTSGLGGVEARELPMTAEQFLDSMEINKVTSEKTIINGINGTKTKYSGVGDIKGYSFVFGRNGLIFNIYINSWDEKNIETFDQILSTFKFTN